MAKRDTKERPYRGVHDEIREQTKKMKDMTFKEKWTYFWYYYKIHVVVIIAVGAFLGSLIYNFVTAKDYCFYGMLLNASMIDGDAMETSFAEYADLDLETYECYVDALSTLSYTSQSEYDLATFQRLVALVQTGDLDSMVLDGQVFYNFAFNGIVSDLRDFMTEEELAAFEGDIYYLDYAEIEEEEAREDSLSSDELLDESADRNNMTAEEIAAEAQTHRDPSGMEDPVPVGIFISDSAFVEKTNAYTSLVPIFGFSATCQRGETARSFLYYLFDETIPFEEMISTY